MLHINPYSIGFDRLFSVLEKEFETTTVSFPYHNLIKEDDTHYRLELAVAGYPRAALDVTLTEKELVVTGKAGEDDRHYVHLGIARRSFTKKFVLAETIQVKGVNLDNGILTIHLENVIPEAKKPQKLDIVSGHFVPDYTTEPQLLQETKKLKKA